MVFSAMRSCLRIYIASSMLCSALPPQWFTPSNILCALWMGRLQYPTCEESGSYESQTEMYWN